jgi:putative membrane protein
MAEIVQPPSRIMAFGWRTARTLLLLCGAALLAMLVWHNDPEAILHSIRQLSWRLLIVIAFPFTLINVFDTLGWRFAFRTDRVPFGALFSARLAGEAFNLTTPTASIGGEAVKAWLLRHHVPLQESLPSVIVAKTTITIAQGLMLIVGLPCAWALLPHDSPLLRVMLWLLVVEVLAVVGFVLFQVGGLLGRGGRVLGRWSFLERFAGGLGQLDDTLAVFYRREPVRLALSTFFHFLGWVGSAVEVWVVLHLLGINISFAAALLVEAFSTAVRFATFMVPASIGALEGGHVAIFTALGLGGTTGLAFSIVRRIREATWIGVGFLALGAYRGFVPASAAVSEH